MLLPEIADGTHVAFLLSAEGLPMCNGFLVASEETETLFDKVDSDFMDLEQSLLKSLKRITFGFTFLLN